MNNEKWGNLNLPQRSTYSLFYPEKISWSTKEYNLYHEILTFVNTLDSFLTPQVKLEQYSLPGDVIALILVLAANDLKGRNVVEFGCGTGRITLPVQKFFSKQMLAVDTDVKVINLLMKLKNDHNLRIDLLLTPIEFLEPYLWGELFHTTIMNPPFGTKRRGIDIVFLRKALAFSQTVISIHKSNAQSRKLIAKISQSYTKSCEILATLEFPILPTFKFHKQKRHYVCVDIYRFKKN